MGFMAGFGEGFASSFEAGNERRAKRKDDLFKLTYSEFLNRREKEEKRKEEDRKTVNKAKTYAQLAGNEDAWPKIAEWVRDGLSESTIMELIEGGEFQTPARTPSTPSTPLPAEDAQMTNAGLTQPSVANAPTAPQTEEPGPLGKLFNTSARDKRRTDEALGQVAQVTGQSPDEVNKIMTGTGSQATIPSGAGIVYKKKPAPIEPDKIDSDNEVYIEQAAAFRALQRDPSPENELRAQTASDRVKAIQTANDKKEESRARADAEKEGKPFGYFMAKRFSEDGRFIGTALVTNDGDGFKEFGTDKLYTPKQIRPWMGEEERKAYDSLSSKVRKQADDYMPKITGTISMLKQARDMAAIVDESGGQVTADWTARMSGYVQAGLHELNTIGSLLNEDKGIDGLEDRLNQAEKEVNSRLKNVTDLGLKKKLFDAKVSIFAYKLGIANGQEGRALSETERKIFENLSKAAGDPKIFKQNLALLMQDTVRTVDDATMVIRDNNEEIKAFQRMFPGWEEEPPFQIVPTIGEYMEKDSGLKSAWEFFKPYMNLNTRNPGQGQTTEDGWTIAPNGRRIRVKPQGQQ